MPTLTLPDLDELLKTIEKPMPRGSWRTLIYNDNHNKFNDVVLWIQKATGCSHESATDITNTCHRTGRAICYSGTKEKCNQVASYLRVRGLQVEVDDGP